MNLENCEEVGTEKSKKKPNKGPYLLGEALGEGAFAKVRLATQIHIKEKCAIKIVDKRLLESAKDIQRLKKEIKILKSIRQKNIIQLFDIMESKRNLYFVLEYCKGGELFDYIVKNKRLKEPEACNFFQQIINGVEYLHKQGIIHRDLKPENLLLDYKNNIKISDFGLSTFFSKNNYLQTACGTPSYAPPEMLEGLQYNGEASDIWSCGIILYAMLCGTLPFTESKEEIIIKKIKTHDYSIPQYLSKEAQDILYHILKINPEERFTIERIKKHPWFNIVTPHLIKGISINEIRIPVDENILEMVKNYGFDKEECRNLLLNNKFCSLTSIYYLCLKKYVREGGKSISDLESDLYEKYINDPNNYINKNKEVIQDIQKKNEIQMEKEKCVNENGGSGNNLEKNTIKNKINVKTKKSNDNIYNGSKKINNKESILEKKDFINNIKENNKKINVNINKNKKDSSNNNNQQISNRKKPKDISNSNKISKNNALLNNNNKQIYKTNNKNIKNNVLIQDKKPKNENNINNHFQEISIKNNNNELKNNIPSNRTKNKSEQNKCNPIIINKKQIKTQNNQKKQSNNIIEKKTPKRFIENNNNIVKKNSNSLINSFNAKNKLMLEKNIINNNVNNNVNNIKNIIHSNTITGNSLNNINGRNINKATFALGVELNSEEAMNNIYEQYRAKEAYQKYRNYLREGKYDNKNKSSPFPIEQFGLDKDMDEKMIMDEKPLNVINYIAKKLVSSSFCGSFNFQYSSAKKYYTSHRSSAMIHNHLIANGNLFMNKEPINEEVEYMKENNEGENNTNNNNNNDNNINGGNDTNNNTVNNNINDINFKNLVSILNQKFKKYVAQNNTKNKQVDNKNNKEHLHNVDYLKNTKLKPGNHNYKNMPINNSSKNKYSKNIEYKEDLYPISFNNKKIRNENYIDPYIYNLDNMTFHYNKFLDISTNYDPGLDSRGESSIERGDSLNRNELRNFSFSLEKNKKKDDYNYRTEYNEKSKDSTYNNVIKNSFGVSHNKFNKNINIISENEELNQNIIKSPKTNKNKHCPFLEKKVFINLSTTFNNMSRSEKVKKSK